MSSIMNPLCRLDPRCLANTDSGIDPNLELIRVHTVQIRLPGPVEGNFFPHLRQTRFAGLFWLTCISILNDPLTYICLLNAELV